MKIALIKENLVVSIVLVNSIEEILPLDKSYQNFIDLEGISPEPRVGFSYIDNEFIDPDNNEASGASVNMKITRLALLNRFTDLELAYYETALASSIPLKILDKKLFAATYIDLARSDTMAGINALVSAGILTQNRANAVLSTEPTELEVYKG